MLRSKPGRENQTRKQNAMLRKSAILRRPGFTLDSVKNGCFLESHLYRTSLGLVKLQDVDLERYLFQNNSNIPQILLKLWIFF